MDRFGGAFGTADADFPEDMLGDELDFIEVADPPSPVGQDERRMQVRAYNHWASLLGNGHLPDIEDLDPGSLDDFGPYSVLLDFSTGIENPAVRYVGPSLAQECDVETAIQRLSDVPPRSLLSRITDHYMQILANEAPIGFEAEFVNQRGATALYRGILLPYSSDGETIDFIFGVINWKELADQRTAEALLGAIDESLARGLEGSADHAGTEDPEEPFELTESLVADVPGGAPVAADAAAEPADAVLELAVHDMVAEEPDGEATEPSATTPHRPGRGIDALGNLLGTVYETETETEIETGTDPDADEPGGAGLDDEPDGFDTRMKTAADYGLPEWDEEPEGQEDDFGLVDPLGGEETTSSLISLVTRGERAKQPVDLGSLLMPLPGPGAGGGEYEDEDEDEDDGDGYGHDTDFAPAPHAGLSWPQQSTPAPADASDTDAVMEQADEVATALPGPLSLYDCLAAAREQAEAASSTEDRSRRALYAAVGLAYDFSLEAEADPEAFAEIVADAGLAMQDRAPMTPVVKLVFGAGYDKTRLTEYAAVLTHARRCRIERGALPAFLRCADGGLKGVVQAERAARREEQGKPAEVPATAIREALAAKLRERPTTALADLSAAGEEFALVMVRRLADGRVVAIGELPAERTLLEKAARRLLTE